MAPILDHTDRMFSDAPLGAPRADPSRETHRGRKNLSGSIPIMRPALPDTDVLLPYLREIDANRWYSNNGPLEIEFGQRLGAKFGLTTTKPVLVANGTSALQIAIETSALPNRKKCLVPSWTFAATPLAVLQAGLCVHFSDIAPETWALSPQDVLARSDLHEFAAIVAVAPFGQAPDVCAWNEVTKKTGIPVIIDAAASFDSLVESGLAALSDGPLIVSLHATKTLGIGEGGLILTRDADLAQQASIFRNFGFNGSRTAQIAGTNAKLSEYHCAVGLAALDAWPERRADFSSVQRLYRKSLASCPFIFPMPGSLGTWVSTTLNVMTLVPSQRRRLEAELEKGGVETRQWWALGCHTHPAFAHADRDPLPQTERLAETVLGLPFSADLHADDIDHICSILRRFRP